MAKYKINSPFFCNRFSSFPLHEGLLFLPCSLRLDLRCVAFVAPVAACSLHLVHYLGCFIREGLQGERDAALASKEHNLSDLFIQLVLGGFIKNKSFNKTHEEWHSVECILFQKQSPVSGTSTSGRSNFPQ